MKKITFGTPEPLTPSSFCNNFSYKESSIQFNTSAINFKATPRGCVITYPMTNDEQIFGFGLQMKSFNHTGHKLTLRVNADPVAATGDSHAPVPFFVSTAGYGIYVDTARYAEFYCGKIFAGQSSPDSYGKPGTVADSTEELYAIRSGGGQPYMTIFIPGAQGIALYIMEGNSIGDIVCQYNMLAGGGCTVPEWGLGILYRCYAKYTQQQVLDTASYFRKAEIPCDILGLEPGWQTHSYSCSYRWDKERFPDPRKMITELGNNGFHVNLWEHAFTHPSSPIYDEIKRACGDYEVWEGVVPDFANPEIRKAFAGYHRRQLVELGVDGFKLDECDSSDYTGGWSFPNCAQFPSGLDGEQYHSLFGTLYMQAILEALGGNSTLSEVRNAGALAASYPFVLYSDLYGHKDFIRATVNSGFGGILWCPEVRHAQSKEDLLRRLQTIVFSVQCLVNAWYCEEVPWAKFDCENEVKALFELRKSLVPMLTNAFEDYHKTGKPPVRALVCDYTDDRETYLLDDQYLFCENLLVAPMVAGEESRKVYIPEGNWRDYFTKQPIASGWLEVKTDNIPVYEKF